MTDNNRCEHGVANGVTYLLIGGGIGAALALLFARKSGRQFRGDIADVSRRGYDATLEKASDLKDRSSEVIHIVKEKAEAAFDLASGKLASGKEAITDAVSSAADAVIDGIGRTQSVPGLAHKQTGNGRKPSNILWEEPLDAYIKAVDKTGFETMLTRGGFKI